MDRDYDEDIYIPMQCLAVVFIGSLIAMAVSTLILLGLISIHTECQCDQKFGYNLHRFINSASLSNTQCRYTANNGTETFLYTYSPDDPCYHSHNNDEYCFEKRAPIDSVCRLKRVIIVLSVFGFCFLICATVNMFSLVIIACNVIIVCGILNQKNIPYICVILYDYISFLSEYFSHRRGKIVSKHIFYEASLKP